MAVRNISEVKPTPKKFRKYHFLLMALFVAAVIFVTTTCISNYAQAAEYSAQAAEVSAEAVRLSEESSEISEILKEENHDEYFEKIAREEYDYCRLGEKVFYNSSYGE